MALAPVSQLIRIRPRPETALQLVKAIKDPVGTVSNYVFTPSIKEHVLEMLEAVRDGKGGGYWVLSEYGGGKTHFLATVASLLSSADQVRDCIRDSDIRQDVRLVQNQKLFPVAFSLIGRAGGMEGRHALYGVLEEELDKAIRERLRLQLPITIASEIATWWDGLAAPIKQAISEKFQGLSGESPHVMRQEDPEKWADWVHKSAHELNISIPIQAAPLHRLKNIYSQITGPGTGYTGLLLVIDELGSWQDSHPEGSVAYSHDEGLLQTLAETLPKDEGLAVFTIVASQKPMPRKFQASRFHGVDLLRASEDPSRVSREYEMVVAQRVRDLNEDRSPEIEEHYDFYNRRFEFAQGLPLTEFRSIFPVQPLCFDILRRITANLATARIGIHVLWDVLGQESEDGPRLHPRLDAMRRLVTTADLLESANLNEALDTVSYAGAYRAYQQAMERLDRIDMDPSEERPLARAVVRTLFLWHVARAGQLPLPLKEMAEAVVADEGMFDSASEAVLSVAALMEDMPQIRYDKAKQEFTFRAEVVTGRPVSEILESYKARFADTHSLDQQWRDFITSSSLGDGHQSALFGKLQPGIPAKAVQTWRGIEYSGEETVANDWYAQLGQSLAFDQHFRVVCLLRNMTVTADALSDNRIVVCVPAELSAQHRDALRLKLALDKMDEEYRARQDDEALRVREFVRTNTNEAVSALLNAQRDLYRKGSILTKANLALDPAVVFSRTERLTALLEGLFTTVFKDRPLGGFRGSRTVKMSTDVGYIFNGLWETSPSGKFADALDNFTVGLGLALQENPRRFNPTNCRVFKIIRDLYQAAQQKGQHLQSSQVYNALAQAGIPARLATLYMLCFVRRAEEAVELILRQGHKLRLKGGIAPPGNRLTASLVRDVEWNNAWADGAGTFELLAPRSGRPWDDTLRWTRAIAPELKTATEPYDVEAQQALLNSSLKELGERAGAARSGLITLVRQVNSSLPADCLTSLEQAVKLADARTYEELVDLAEERFSGPDKLGDLVSAVHRLHRLSQQAGAITGAYAYLSSVPPGRLVNDLEIDRTALLGRIDLPSMAGDPDLWPPIENGFQNWKRRYQIEYKKFHREYQNDLAHTEARRLDADQKLVALGHLEQVPGLAGERRAAQLQASLQSILGRLNKCKVGVTELALDAQPHCSACQVRYGDAPVDGVDSLIAQTDRALDDLLKAFQGQAIQRLLQASTEPGIQEFRSALDVSDKSRLIVLLQSPDSVRLLSGVLEKGKVKVKRTRVMATLAQEFPTVSRSQLNKVVQRFTSLMEESLRQAEAEAGPDAQVQVSLE